MTTELRVITDALERLDQRTHRLGASLELRQAEDDRGGWVAQIVADPLWTTLTAWGRSADEALSALARDVEALNWRRMRRR